MNRIWKMSLIIVGIIFLDQFSKGYIQSVLAEGDVVSIIEGFFNFSHVRNSGIAWGIGSGVSEFWRVSLFIWIPIGACFWLLGLIWTTRNERLLLPLSYSLILGGAIGNLIDRYFLGYVVDFLDFYFKGVHFPSFNVADSSITIAAGLILFDSLRQYKKEKESKVV